MSFSLCITQCWFPVLWWQSPCQYCKPLPCLLRDTCDPKFLGKQEVEGLTTDLWCWCKGAFCRWLTAASSGSQAHPSLLITCATPFVTPEVLLSPVIQGRFFYCLLDLLRKISSASLLRCVSSELFSNCLQPVRSLTCENNENACTCGFPLFACRH